MPSKVGVVTPSDISTKAIDVTSYVTDLNNKLMDGWTARERGSGRSIDIPHFPPEVVEEVIRLYEAGRWKVVHTNVNATVKVFASFRRVPGADHERNDSSLHRR